MTIKELRILRPDIADRAIANQVAQGNKPNEDMQCSAYQKAGNFDFSQTLEGSDYWVAVYRKDFIQADRILSEKEKVSVEFSKEETAEITISKITISGEDYENLKNRLSALTKENEELKAANVKFTAYLNNEITTIVGQYGSGGTRWRFFNEILDEFSLLKKGEGA